MCACGAPPPQAIHSGNESSPVRVASCLTCRPSRQSSTRCSGPWTKGKAQRKLAPAWWWSRVSITADTHPAMAKLRLFCRLRGIELPYRRAHPAGHRAVGLSRAAQRLAAQPRADRLVWITDLHGLLERPELTSQALGRARHRGASIVAVVPFGPLFAPRPEHRRGQTRRRRPRPRRNRPLRASPPPPRRPRHSGPTDRAGRSSGDADESAPSRVAPRRLSWSLDLHPRRAHRRVHRCKENQHRDLAGHVGRPQRIAGDAPEAAMEIAAGAVGHPHG